MRGDDDVGCQERGGGVHGRVRRDQGRGADLLRVRVRRRSREMGGEVEGGVEEERSGVDADEERR